MPVRWRLFVAGALRIVTTVVVGVGLGWLLVASTYRWVSHRWWVGYERSRLEGALKARLWGYYGRFGRWPSSLEDLDARHAACHGPHEPGVLEQRGTELIILSSPAGGPFRARIGGPQTDGLFDVRFERPSATEARSYADGQFPYPQRDPFADFPSSSHRGRP